MTAWLKASLLGAALCALATPAMATRTPVARSDRPSELLAETSMIPIGLPAALLESDYFQTPQEPIAAGRIFPCRLQLFEKIRVARACH